MVSCDLFKKNRHHLITPQIESELHQYITHKLSSQKCFVRAINGTSTHLHILFKTNLRIAPSEIIGVIKGSSSYWLNRHPKNTGRFDWQRGYAVLPVPEAKLDTVAAYIENQKQIHAKRNGDNKQG